MSKRFKILSIDGGGFRGVFSAHLLMRIEQELNIDWLKQFDFLAGTSTGSILAAGLACGLSGEELCEFYKRHGKEIFSPRFRSLLDPLKIFTSRYSNKTLTKLLKDKFGERKLGDLQIPLLMPSVDIGQGCVHVLKSKYNNGFIRDPETFVADAIQASCSAPTYFDPHFVEEKYQLVDGGLWANNPSLAAVIDAKYRLEIPLDNISVLSIGTGTSKAFYPKNKTWFHDWFIRSWQGWGFATRWQRNKLIDLILNLQASSTHNMLCLLLGEDVRNPNPERVCRLSFEADIPLPMDSTRKFDDWINKADHCFSHNIEDIKRNLQLT